MYEERKWYILFSFVFDNTSVIFFVFVHENRMVIINHEFYFYEKDGLSNNEWSEISMYNKTRRLQFFTYHMSRSDRLNRVELNEISIREYPVRWNILKKTTKIKTWYETDFLLNLNYVLYITIIRRGTTQEQVEGNQKWFVAW